MVAFLWLLYLLYAPASINPAPPPRPVPQVVAGRVTGTVPPPNGSWAFLRELISPSEWLALIQIQLLPFWELLHLLMRALFDLLRTGYRWVCRAVAARHSSLARPGGRLTGAGSAGPAHGSRVRSTSGHSSTATVEVWRASRSFRSGRDGVRACAHAFAAYRRGCRRGYVLPDLFSHFSAS